MENIYGVVLLSEKTTAQRKARVSKYRHWVSKPNLLNSNTEKTENS